MRYWIIATCIVLGLSSCTAVSVTSTNEEVSKAVYRHNGPTRLTLFTMLRNSSGSGRHSSLMINGSQRVIFDPAGTFRHPEVAEQNDVLFGVTPKIVDLYTRYHARKSFHVLIQEVNVSPQVAEAAIRAVRAQGAAPAGRCTQATSSALSSVAGLQQFEQTWYPKKLSEQFAKMPGVTSRKLHEYDSDDNSKILKEWHQEY